MKLTLTYHCIWHFSVTSYYHFNVCMVGAVE
jgi:hypothetical protein